MREQLAKAGPWLPVALNVLVFPGLGQAWNRRWLKALLFGASFVYPAKRVLEGFAPIAAAAEKTLATGIPDPGLEQAIGPLLGWTLLVTLIYALAAGDAYLEVRRAQKTVDSGDDQ